MPLRAWYPLNGNANNMGASNLTLTQTTAPAWSTGKTSSQSMTTGAFKWTAAQSNSIFNNNEFSYACWFYVDAASGTSASDYKKIFGAEGGTNSMNRKFTCGQYPTVNGFHVSSWNGSSLIGCCRLDDALPSYKWTHICYSYKKGAINIYINGVLKKTTALTMANSSYSAETPVLWNYSGRRICDVRVYDHALSQKEAAELAKGLMLHIPMYAGYTGVGTNLCAGWREMQAKSLSQYYTVLLSDNNFFGLKVGDTYTYRLKITAPAEKGVRARVQYYTDGNTRTGPSSGITVAAGTTGYSYLTDTITEAKRAYTRMELLITSADTSVTTTNTTYVGEVKLELGSTPTPWSSSTDTDYAFKDCSGYQVSVGTNGTVPTVSGDAPRYGVSARINGSTGCIWPIADPIKSTTTEFTISVWFKTTTVSGNQCIWNGRSSSSSGSEAVGIFLINNTIRVDDSIETNSATISANTWYHLAVTWKSGGNKIVYLNGVQKTSVAVGNLTKSNTKASIGRSSVADSLTQNYFSGQMSDFRIYATALTAAQVKELYNAPISVANTGACLAEQFTEGASGIAFAKTGVVSANQLITRGTLVEPDGSRWIQVCHHADPTSYKFASSDPFSTGVWKDWRRFLDGGIFNMVNKWEFIIEQKQTATAAIERYRWAQQVNPNSGTYETTVAANITRYGSSAGYNDSGYGGVYKFNSSTYYCCNDGHKGDWMGAIGAWNGWSGGIPGYGAAVKDGGFLDMYMRVDNVTWSTSKADFSLDKDGLAVLSPEFIEQ